jgi:hypothetical protein
MHGTIEEKYPVENPARPAAAGARVVAGFRLFISHSSRPDGGSERCAEDPDANRRLLRETCACLEDTFQDRLELLYDERTLSPGDDWSKRLDTFVDECHAAIVLISHRALHVSDWVKKELSNLEMRKRHDPDFLLIPVTIEGESRPEDLTAGFYATLNLARFQVAHANAPTGQSVVEKIAESLRAAIDHHRTPSPLDLLQAYIRDRLEAATSEALEAAVLELDCKGLGLGQPKTRYARGLALHLYQAAHRAAGYVKPYKTVCNKLELSKEPATKVFHSLRFLWVDPDAAECLNRACEDGLPRVLAGKYTSSNRLEPRTPKAPEPPATKPGDRCKPFTVVRYLRRAWPDDSALCVIVAKLHTVEDVQTEIRRQVLRGFESRYTSEEADDWVRRSTPGPIVVTIPWDEPDPRLLDELRGLKTVYPGLVLLFTTPERPESLEDPYREILPVLNPKTEDDADLAETITETYLQDRYSRT